MHDAIVRIRIHKIQGFTGLDNVVSPYQALQNQVSVLVLIIKVQTVCVIQLSELGCVVCKDC